ncbi:hypothetical protein LLEC1_01928 [Akanthomyces lecanii]|uniref:Uncharacterized protein n=1 Tax=Cordyceps confragosa TaxID=2714763 RepID=A0A179I832_CORDF|nr:hypothetical protein LLEC1_01928 [Akanthomyces lecanii]
MWNECQLFWARYQYIVIDQGNFHLRPRLGRDLDKPPACGGGAQEPRTREFEPGRCPRPACPSRQALLRPQLQLQHKMLHKRNAQMPPPLPPILRAGLRFKNEVDSVHEARDERRRREFAARFFVKRPVRPIPRFDGADEEEEEANDDDGDGFYHGSRRAEKSAIAVDGDKTGLSGQTFRVRAPLDSLPCASEDLSQSCGSTIIESGSEVDSCDWNETYQSLRPLKIQSV